MRKMKRVPIFITGADTGVGKTVLTALLARHLRQTRRRVAACKPVCSGGREDALLLAAALGGELTLDEINPWHFRAPIAPVLAARRERQRVTLHQIVGHARKLQKSCDVLLIEGAGGLLSPLGEDVDSLAVIAALRALPFIVGVNRLGVINHLRLTLDALPPSARAKAIIVLMSPEKPDDSTRGNPALLAEYFEAKRIFELPWLGQLVDFRKALKNTPLQKTLARITKLSTI
jgi:dethiobiotin synthetase